MLKPYIRSLIILYNIDMQRKNKVMPLDLVVLAAYEKVRGNSFPRTSHGLVQ